MGFLLDFIITYLANFLHEGHCHYCFLMVKSFNSRRMMLLLLSISVLLVGYIHEAKAYTSVVESGSGLTILICPSGEKHQAAIAFEA